MIRAGQLDQRITIETPMATEDALGAEVTEWLFLAEVSASVREQLGREFLKGDFHAEGKATFQIRWIDDLNSKARVRWGGRTWMIEDVTGTYRSGECWLHCRSVSEAN